MKRIVIIGVSVAGHTVAVNVRNRYKECAITLVTEEASALYDKRRLADLVTGREEEGILLCREDFYAQQKIELIKDSKVTAVNTDKRMVYSRNQEALAYDFLVISSGRKYILPQIPGAKKEGVFNLNTLDDAKKLVAYVIGDSVCMVGYDAWARIIAGALRVKNKEVKLLCGRELAAMPIEGVEVINSYPTEIIGESQAQAVKLAEGKIIGTHAVVFMNDLKSNIEFLKNTSVELSDDYILVDDNMRTSVGNVFACGSVCMRRGAEFKIKTREEVENEASSLADNLVKALETDTLTVNI